ncbi:GIY-YIG nuclease family protein [Lentilactobacillus sp. Marseille-Q4993]|uniref:GIY-YIG nuclease family protein n=1 Tax=Lentilactobacillus sp. Marseille-Q4993 TaxID=3039492 RepID=UPI0024BC5B2A|nr:GIY-YIG nuclease family protein [Lentilactobacillus sp. Marseille-Q4993]
MDTENEKFFMYVLLCQDGSLYTGYTNDVKRRFAAHLSGKGARYTRAHKPQRILYQEEFDTKHDALSAEFHFKQLPRAKKIQYIRLHTK